MKFANQLTKEQIVIFVKKLFGKNFKSLSLDAPKNNDNKIHGSLKLTQTKGSVPFSFDDFNFILGFIRIDTKVIDKFGSSLTEKKNHINKKFRTYMNDLYGKKYYTALETFLIKDEKMEKVVANQKIKLIEEKYNFLEKEIKGKIAQLEKELKESNQKREKELESVNSEIEELITSNQEILTQLKHSITETLSKN